MDLLYRYTTKQLGLSRISRSKRTKKYGCKWIHGSWNRESNKKGSKDFNEVLDSFKQNMGIIRLYIKEELDDR